MLKQVATILYPVNPNDVRGNSADKILWSVGLVTSYANNSSSFYVYCCSGRSFRQELVHMLTRQHSAQPGQGTVFTMAHSPALQRTVVGNDLNPPPSRNLNPVVSCSHSVNFKQI